MVKSPPVARIYGIIPARWGSTRFPGKPLHLLAGKPLIQHVWERCGEASRLARILIATDDLRIAETARAFGAQVELTASEHPSGTDRLAEVAERFPDATHILNVQGDEPTVPGVLLDALCAALTSDGAPEMVTAATPLQDVAEAANPHCVKVVLAANGDALYFSRSPIPYPGFAGGAQPLPLYRHQGLYGYTRDFLRRFVAWPQGVLERTERLEQLRALENGARIRVVITGHESLGVDTPADLAPAEAALLARALNHFPTPLLTPS